MPAGRRLIELGGAVYPDINECVDGFARWAGALPEPGELPFLREPAVILAYEPTQGVDVGERRVIHRYRPAVGAINKGLGLPASIAGTLLGGVAVTRIGVRRSLLIFGVLQAAPNLLYAYLGTQGPDHGLLAIIVSVDQFCNGLATAALVVYLMSLCDRRFTAFQYAFLSSATSVLGRIVSGWSGVMQESVGWSWFFALTALAALPALLVLLFLPADVGLPATPGKVDPE